MMFNLIGPDVLNGANEATLLQHIKQVAVQPTHVEVHRQKFFRMTQADGETVKGIGGVQGQNGHFTKYDRDFYCRSNASDRN